jgi:hypothetical protein
MAAKNTITAATRRRVLVNFLFLFLFLGMEGITDTTLLS